MNIFSKIWQRIFPGMKDYPKIGAGKTIALGFQHAFAMACATILVPLLTGLDVGVALFAAGLGTIIFHICTGGRMPTFLGSSFAFITAIAAITGGGPGVRAENAKISEAMGGIIVAGVIYLLFALLIKLLGKGFIDKLFPPVVRGVGIAIIGLNLSSAAINNIQGFANFTTEYYWSWGIALFVCLLAIILSCYGKGMLKLSSIVIALAAGYLVTYLCVKVFGIAPDGLMDMGKMAQHSWFEVPDFVLPTFTWKAIGTIAPIAIVTCVEHVGDVYANSEVVGRDFAKNPGLHRTMLGDGLATIAAGCVGGPANTTYSENTAVLAVTGNYNPGALRFAAFVAIAVSFFGKAIGAIETVPNFVLGGACIVLYGMIASVGLRTLVENKVDFKSNRNLSIAAVMLVLAIGGAVWGVEVFSISGIGLGIIAGILLNLILPKEKDAEKSSASAEDKNE